ncbi:MAG: class I SAM-dependent methyltransferase [Nitrospirota bacterium]
MTYRCRICNTSGDHPVYTVREMMLGSGDRFLYFECTSCRCLQIAEIPADMGKYYPRDYYSFSTTSRDKTGNTVIKAARRIRNYSSVSEQGFGTAVVRTLFPNKKLLPLMRLGLTPASRILDVGCGSGWRLYALREAGFPNTLGVDPYLERDILYANGLQVLKRTVNEVEGAWDVVMFHHSLEHIPDQAAALRAAAGLLRPGGACLIRVPVASSYAWEHYREHWYQIDAPRHFYLHSYASMRLLAERCGLVLRSTECDSTLDQFRTSELYKRGLRSLGEAGFTRSEENDWKRRAANLNQEGRGDQAVFYFGKAETR